MIEIIPTLLTPAMLACSPLNAAIMAAPQYDWKTQAATTRALDIGKAKTTRMITGTQSYVGNNLTIDDWR